jgi:hypothetical protein
MSKVAASNQFRPSFDAVIINTHEEKKACFAAFFIFEREN